MRAFAFFFGIFTCLLGIGCAVFQLSMAFRVLTVGLVFIALWMMLKYAKCPVCHEYGVNINPFSRKYGICKKCGHQEPK